MNAPDHWLLQRIAGHGAKTFLHAPEGSFRYDELLTAVTAACIRLDHARVTPGEVVALVGDYGLSTLAHLVALIVRRNVVVPLTPMAEAEIVRRVAIVNAAQIIRCGGATPTYESRADAGPHALIASLAHTGRSGLVLFSSGSTGAPKAMLHDLDRLLDHYRDRRARALVLIVFLMFDHIGGLNTLFTAVASGATIVVSGKRDPDDVCALIARHRVAVLPTSPTFLNLVLLSDAWKRHDLSSLRIITYGTEPMPESLLQRLRAALPHVKLIQTFGTSETGITHTTSKSSDSTLIKLDDPEVEHRIVDDELWLRSRTQILGYLNHASTAFTADGWFKTGDLVEPAPDGFLRIAGRRSELINVGGEKVLPGEVEAVLLEMPEITDAVVGGEPNAITGQMVVARVVLAPGADPATIRQRVRLHGRARLAPYKIPVKVLVVAATAFSTRFKKVRRPEVDVS